jgi:Uma2 family endonuclease
MATTATMSGLQFDALPYQEGRRWELLEGDLIEAPSPTPRHQDTVVRVLLALKLYLENGEMQGLAFPDVEFALSDRSRLRPDVCLLLEDKTRSLDLDLIPIPGAPDLAVEIISPSERTSECHDKVFAYLRNGTGEVWQFYPKSRTIQIYKGETSSSRDSGGQITSDLLPGLAVPVSSLFG